MTRIKQEYFESTDYFVLFFKTKNKAETQKSNFFYKIHLNDFNKKIVLLNIWINLLLEKENFKQHYVPFIQVTVFHFELNNS